MVVSTERAARVAFSHSGAINDFNPRRRSHGRYFCHRYSDWLPMIRAFFLLLAVVSQFANAETIPATSGPLTFVVENYAPSGQTTSVQSSYQAACDAGLVLWQTKYPSSGFFLKGCQVANPTAGVNQNYGTARYGYGSSGGEYTGIIIVKSVGYSCPSGQNWTLDGATCISACLSPLRRARSQTVLGSSSARTATVSIRDIRTTRISRERWLESPRVL